jgi:hypothetical protein
MVGKARQAITIWREETYFVSGTVEVSVEPWVSASTALRKNVIATNSNIET